MSHHAAYSLPIEFLDVVLIEDSRPMQMILRSMLSALRARRIRVFDDGARALSAMVREPPNLVITDWRMPGMSGSDFLKTLRSADMAPLCFIPVMVVTAHATQTVVEATMRYGAQTLLVKPVAPATLLERIQWIVNDKRRFVLGTGRTWAIEGAREKLVSQKLRADALKAVRANQDRRLAEAKTARSKPVRLDLAAADEPTPLPLALDREEAPLPLASPDLPAVIKVADPKRRPARPSRGRKASGWGEVRNEPA